MIDITYFIISFVVLIFSIVIHEVAHGTMAYSLGDMTAKVQGRLSLNPIKHIDPVGTIILPLGLIIIGSPVVFGWAKPVPVNFMNLRDRKWGSLKVALAGPLTNLSVAVVCGLILRFLSLPEGMVLVLWLAVFYNVLLAIFNLIPIPPLDGSHILFSFIKGGYEFKRFLAQWGFLILIFVLFMPGFQSLLFNTIDSIVNIITGINI